MIYCWASSKSQRVTDIGELISWKAFDLELLGYHIITPPGYGNDKIKQKSLS